MAQILSGLFLFVAMTILANAVIVCFAFAATYGAPLPAANLDEYLFFGGMLGGFAFANAVILAALAWRGRRYPLTDGTLALNLLLIGHYLVQLGRIILEGPPPFPEAMPMFYQTIMMGVLFVCLVPAHIITVLTFGRTPLLRGLVAPPKSKGPAEASPS